MDQGPRFPAVAENAGHYESFYVKACQPGGGRGIWIRHTVHKRPGSQLTASIWFVFFDRSAAGPRATKLTLPHGDLSAPAEGWIRIGDTQIGPGHADGAINTDALAATWSFRFAGDEGPCMYLPAEWLYRTKLPKTKFVAPYPNALFDGALVLDGEEISISSWPGMIAHNWGTEHAERWVWLEGTGFAEEGDTWFDAGAARVALGSRTSPWIPSGVLSLDGERHRLGGLGSIRSAAISAKPGRCDFILPGKDITVRGRVEAPLKDHVAWIYADPAGPEHNTLNCSVSDLELRVERSGRLPRVLTLAGGAAYEFGMRETDHGVPVQPYPDG
jgi:hypothetical protein